MVVIDSSVLVRWLTRDDDELSLRADKIINQAKAGTFLLDRLILEELSYVLKGAYHFPRTAVSYNLQSLVQDDRFVVVDRTMVEDTLKLFGSEKPLSFEDCWLLMLKQTGRVTTIATFDKALLKRIDPKA